MITFAAKYQQYLQRAKYYPYIRFKQTKRNIKV